MGKKTGRPRGRPPGVKNKRSAERDAILRKVEQHLTETVDDVFEGDAHAFLMTVYKTPTYDIGLRVDAAKAAVKYEKPALAAIEHAGADGGPIQCQRVERITVDPAGDTED